MKKVLLLLTALAVQQLCNATEITLPSFQSVIIEDSYHVTLRQGEKAKLIFKEGFEKYATNTKHAIENNGQLLIQYDGTKTELVEIIIETPEISAITVKDNARLNIDKKIISENLLITLSGTGSMEMVGINCKKIDIDFNGIGRFEVKDSIVCDSLFAYFDGVGQSTLQTIKAKKITITQNGTSGCEIQGSISCNRLYTTMNGAGRFNAQKEIQCKLLEARMQGTGSSTFDEFVKAKRIKAYLRGIGKIALPKIDCERVDADLNGIGNITLGGKAQKLERIVSGFGSINIKNLKVGDDEENYDD